MIRPRSTPILIAVLALAPACSSQSSAPKPADGSSNLQPESRKFAHHEDEEEEAAAGASARDESPPAAAAPLGGEPEADAAAPGGARKAKEDTGSRIKAEPMTSGGLDRDIVRRRVLDHEADLQACVRDQTGSLTVKLEVDARGLVKDVKLGPDGDLDDQNVVDCILAQISKWSFAADATGKASVELKLEF